MALNYNYSATGSLNDSGDVIESDSYDGTGRQVTQTDSTGQRTDLYYSSSWQVIEERQNGQTTTQNVWSPVCVNALLLQDGNTTGNPADGLNQRIYATTDANYNVTALVTKPTGPSTWQVVQRFYYDAYGTSHTVGADWNPTLTPYSWNILYQGGRLDAASGLYTFQNRQYSPSLMRWMQQDPMGYVNGMNDYEAFGLSPIGNTDSSGLFWNPVLLLKSATSAIGSAVLWTGSAIAHPYKTIYTGDPNATDEAYDQATSGAAAWLAVNSPVRGGYVSGGYEKGEGTPFKVELAASASWTIDDGYSFAGEAGAGLGNENTSAKVGVAAGYNQDNGWDGEIGGDFASYDSEAAVSTEGAVSLGISKGPFAAGLIVDPSKLLNVITPSNHSDAIDDLLYSNHRASPTFPSATTQPAGLRATKKSKDQSN